MVCANLLFAEQSKPQFFRAILRCAIMSVHLFTNPIHNNGKIFFYKYIIAAATYLDGVEYHPTP